MEQARHMLSDPRWGAVLAAGLALVALLPIWWHTGRWYQSRMMAEQQAQVSSELAIHGATLTSAVHRYMTLLEGVGAFVHAEVHSNDIFPVDEFTTLAAGLSRGTSSILNITIAPDGIQRYVYPLSGNRHLIGQNLSTVEYPRTPSAGATDLETSQPSICRLYQDTLGTWRIMMCQTLFHRGSIWGMVTMELDLSAILREVGLADPMMQGGVEAAIRSDANQVFFGDPAIFETAPIAYRISLSDGYWEMGAAPTEAWYSPVREASLIFRGAGLMIVVLLVGLVYLVDNRHARLALAVRERTREISEINQALEQRVQDRTGALSALYEVTAVANSSLDIDTLLRRSLNEVVEVTKIAAAAIYLVDRSDSIVHFDVDERLGDACRTFLQDNLLETGLVGRVLEAGQPLIIADVLADLRGSVTDRPVETRGYVGVPIRSRGQTLGVLGVVGRSGQDFEPDDMSLLVSIGEQLGGAVQNARLFRDAQGKATLEERQRLARELHDSVTQSLYSLSLFAAASQERAAAQEWEHVGQNLERIGNSAQQALKDMRLLVFELRHSSLEQMGLVGSLQLRLSAVEKRSGVQTRLDADPALAFPPDTEEALFYIAQEALNNALKHAAAMSVTVRLHKDEEWVTLEVEDTGCGFDPEAAIGQGGMGLSTMREWADRIGGSIRVQSAPDRGSLVQVRVRLAQAVQVPAGEPGA